MTLILTVLTHDYVIQASDRRLTFLGGPNAGRIADDERNKAVVYAGVAVIAYTGIADVGTEGYTDYWIVNTIATAAKVNPKIGNVFDALGRSADNEFSAIRRAKPAVPLNHAFVIAGWRKVDASAPARPYVWAIANCLDDNWHWFRDAEPYFTRRVRNLADDEPFHLFTAGAHITPLERTALERQLGRAIRKKKGSDRVAHLLVRAIRGVNERQHRKTVGRSVLVVSVPPPSPRPRQGVVIAVNRKLTAEAISSVYFPGNSMTAAMYGPHNVGPSGMASRDWQVFTVVPFPRSMDIPWLKGVIVLCPHAKGPAGFEPQVARDHPETVWSPFAEIASQGRDDLPRPVVVVIHFETPAIASILSGPRLFVLIQPTEDDRRAIESWPSDSDEVPRVGEADRAALDPWLNAIREHLVRYGVSEEAVKDFIDAMRGRQRGWVVLALKEFFDGLGPPPK